MPLVVPCVICKAKFQVPSKMAGKTVRCKNCGSAIRLPSPEQIQAKKQAPAQSGKRPAPAAKGASAQKSPLLEEPFELLELQDAEPGNMRSAAAGAASTVPEPTVLSCSHCEGLLYYDPNFANQTVACPHCGNHLIMPEL
jgi:DNA-directed RNA polymerase subunit RPC12/RpoP